jgi:hypothetical protein
MSMLVGKVWKMDVPTSYDAYISYTKIFTTTTFTTTLQVPERPPRVDTYQYYLSEVKDTFFDESKLGHFDYNQYLVLRVDDNDIQVFEVLSLTENRLELQHVITKSIIKYNAQ